MVQYVFWYCCYANTKKPQYMTKCPKIYHDTTLPFPTQVSNNQQANIYVQCAWASPISLILIKLSFLLIKIRIVVGQYTGQSAAGFVVKNPIGVLEHVAFHRHSRKQDQVHNEGNFLQPPAPESYTKRTAHVQSLARRQTEAGHLQLLKQG